MSAELRDTMARIGDRVVRNPDQTEVGRVVELREFSGGRVAMIRWDDYPDEFPEPCADWEFHVFDSPRRGTG